WRTSKYNVDIYRLRCYLASLQGSELPNPQTLLASIARPTKLALGKLGVFSVASLHAIVSARSIPSSTSNYGSFKFSRSGKAPLSPTSGKWKSHKNKMFQRMATDKRSSLRSMEISGPYPMLPPSALHSLAQSYSEMEETTDTDAPPSFSHEPISPLSPVIKIFTPGNRVVSVPHRDNTTITDILHAGCRVRQLESRDHFIRLRNEREDGGFECEIPGPNELLRDQEYTHLEMCQKWTHTVFLSQPDIQNCTTTAFGLMLEPVWDVGGNRLETVLVSRVEEGGVADRCGVWEGDEMARMNGRSVREAGWVGTRSSLDAPTVSLSLKTCHIEMPVSELTNQIVESLICPAPPSSNTELSQEAIQQLTVPTPARDDTENSNKSYSGSVSREQINSLLKDSSELSKLLKSWDVQRVREERATTWTTEDRLRKSAQDLLDTERDYVRLLHVLVETVPGAPAIRANPLPRRPGSSGGKHCGSVGVPDQVSPGTRG
ncbi:T-lymphoma invasion and metastasis-inducing protein 1, partial [Geodia barretti]